MDIHCGVEPCGEHEQPSDLTMNVGDIDGGHFPKALIAPERLNPLHELLRYGGVSEVIGHVQGEGHQHNLGELQQSFLI